MKRHAIFVFLLVTYVFWNNFFMMLETGENAFGGVRYYVDLDSINLKKKLYDITVEKFEDCKISVGFDDCELVFWSPQFNENFFCIVLSGKKACCMCSIASYGSLNSVIKLTGYRSISSSRPKLVSKILSDGFPEHNISAWRSFEKEVLDKLGIEYKKDWGHLYRNWYARWFFKNQLYIIAFFVSSYILYCCVEKFNNWRRYYVKQKRE